MVAIRFPSSENIFTENRVIPESKCVDINTNSKKLCLRRRRSMQNMHQIESRRIYYECNRSGRCWREYPV